jgi:hypothetical protein
VNYWITTHYPHPVPDTAPWHIYFRKRPATIAQPGDLVLFYETYEPQADRDRTGRKAVVCAAVVSGPLKPMSGIEPWNLQIPCSNHRSGRDVPLDRARKLIPGPFFRQTLRRLKEEQYKAVAEEMGVWP